MVGDDRVDVIEACYADGSVKPMAEIEREMILYTIGRCRGSKSETARVLGIGRSTLYRKLEEIRRNG